MRSRRIGIIGGTFNPPHIGHMIFAQEAAIQLDLERVVFVPAYLPPHKKLTGDDARSRYKMTALACMDNPRFEASDIEIRHRSISYTVDTLKKLKKDYGKDVRLFFLVGSDNDLSTWKDIDEAQRLATFVITKRPGSKVMTGKRILRITIPSVDISSSQVRKRVRLSQPIDYLVPVSVRDYIRKRGLYK